MITLALLEVVSEEENTRKAKTALPMEKGADTETEMAEEGRAGSLTILSQILRKLSALEQVFSAQAQKMAENLSGID